MRAAAYLAVDATVIALARELVGRMAPRSDAELTWIAAQAVRATGAVRDGDLSIQASG
ncbi:MAG: hypothetical protein H0T39_14495 [Actinobacteria bacterium]|nr:hypothetical protein [Actinomycetota bacterium]